MHDIEQDESGEAAQAKIKHDLHELQKAIEEWSPKYAAVIAPRITAALSEMVGKYPNLSSAGFMAIDESNGCSAADDEDEDGNPLLVPIGKTLGKRKRAAQDVAPQRKRSPLYEATLGIDIVLPSSCERGVWKHDGMQELREIEVKLRAGQANDALNLLRTELITSYAFTQERRTLTGRGQELRSMTQALKKLQGVRRAAAAYRRAYSALSNLGWIELPGNAPDPGEEPEYRELNWSDVVPLVIEVEAQKLGDSKKGPSWIWYNLKFIDNNDMDFRAVCIDGEC